MAKKQFTTEQLAQRWEDRREVKNIMGKYVVSFLIKREKTMFEDFWSKKDDVCLGVNEGWFAGAEAIKAYFAALDKRTTAVRDKLIELFPDRLKDMTPDELYGIGVFDLRSITNAVVEIAADGQTAKGMWHCYGLITDVDEHGPVSSWVFGTYVADFIKEGDDWKLWHVQYLEDIKSPSGANWSSGVNKYPELPEFASLKGINAPAPNNPSVLRERYSVNRPFTKLPRIPEPYDTFADTFSYGM